MAKRKTNQNSGPVVLLVLDGWGLAKKSEGNAIELAKKPNFNKLWRKGSHTQLAADGPHVGLPAGRVGNSEAGHITIGAGRVVDQDAVTINKAINTGKFFKNPAFEAAAAHVKKHKSKLHLMGMLTNGQSGHADPDHMLALLSWARNKKIPTTYLHLFTDGRDSPPHSSLKMTEAMMRSMRNSESGNTLKGEWIATIQGRFYAMDRKKQWDRTGMAYHALTMSEGRKAKSPQAAITQAYNRKLSDEFIDPYVIYRHGKPIAKIKNKDAIIFTNLRSDRARQLTKAFVQKDFNAMNPGSFKRKKTLKDLLFVAMTDFGPDLPGILTAFPAEDLEGTLPMALENYNQMYIGEREKYAHVTFFFNGGYANPVAGEGRVVIPSPDVMRYDEKPGMATLGVAANIMEALPTHDFICANFSGADMIAHTGNLKATIKSVEIIDEAVGKIAQAVAARKGTLIITADHGNAEVLLNPETGEIDTEHNANPVPFLLLESRKAKRRLRQGGGLQDIAPTILKLMDVKPPKQMTGKPLFK